jgi:hypothetical protein
MADLVTILAPLAGAERDVGRVERLLHLRRHERSAPEGTEPAASADPDSPLA